MPSGRPVSRRPVASRVSSSSGALKLLHVAAAVALSMGWAIAPAWAQEQPGASKSSPAAIRQYNAAVGLYNKKLYDVADDEWAAFVKDFPDDPRVPDALLYLGVCLKAQQDYKGAADAYGRLIDQFPQFDKRDQALSQLAEVQLAAGTAGDAAQLNAAIATCRKLLALDAKGKYAPNSYYFTGEAYYALKKYADAADAYGQLFAKFPKSDLADDALYAQGVSFEDGQKPDEAERKYAEFTKTFPASPLASEVKFRRGTLFYAKADYASAAPLFLSAAGDEKFKLADLAQLRSADCAFAQKQYGVAAAAYQAFLTARPTSDYRSRARLELGRSFYLQNDYPKARTALEALVAEADPLSLEASHWIAQSYLKERKPEQAAAAADRALAVPNASQLTGVVQLKLDLADALFETPESRDKALQQYVEIAKRHTDDPLAADAEYLAAFTAFDLGDYKQALELGQGFLKTRKSNSLEPDVRFIVAQALQSQKQYAAADAAYRELMDKFPNHAVTQKAPFRRAATLSLDGKHDEAIALLNKVIAGKPTSAVAAEAQHMLGRCYVEKKEWPAAVKALRAALAAKSDWRLADETLLLLGFATERSGDVEGAVGEWKKLLDGFPESSLRAEAFYRTAEARYRQGQFAAASRAYQSLLDATPDHTLAPAARHGLALSLFSEGQFAQSVELLDDLVAAKPAAETANQARYTRGLALRRLQKWKEAAADLQAFIAAGAAGKELSDARFELALCQVGQEQWDAAIKTLRSINADDPNYSASDSVDYELAWALKAQGDEAGAAAAFKRIADTKPDSSFAGESLYHVAEAAYAANDYALAGEQYKSALAKLGASDLAESAGYRLAWSLFLQDQFEASHKAFASLQKAHPEGKYVGDALLMQGECELKQQKFAPALAAYEKAIPVLAREDKPSLHQTALLHAAQAASKLPTPDYKKSLDFCATFLKAYYEELASLDETGLLSDAYYEQGFANEKLNRLEDALASYERSAKHSAGESAARACFRRGEILFGKKDHKEAIRWYYKAAYSYDYPKWSAASLYEAGRCFEVLKKTDEAKAAYAEVLEKYADSDQAAEARARLSALGG